RKGEGPRHGREELPPAEVGAGRLFFASRFFILCSALIAIFTKSLKSSNLVVDSLSCNSAESPSYRRSYFLASVATSSGAYWERVLKALTYAITSRFPCVRFKNSFFLMSMIPLGIWKE